MRLRHSGQTRANGSCFLHETPSQCATPLAGAPIITPTGDPPVLHRLLPGHNISKQTAVRGTTDASMDGQDERERGSRS